MTQYRVLGFWQQSSFETNYFLNVALHNNHSRWFANYASGDSLAINGPLIEIIKEIQCIAPFGERIKIDFFTNQYYMFRKNICSALKWLSFDLCQPNLWTLTEGILLLYLPISLPETDYCIQGRRNPHPHNFAHAFWLCLVLQE